MSVIVEFTVESEEFLLDETFRTCPEVAVEIERVVALPDGRVTPYFWVSEGDCDSFEAAVHDDPSVENVSRVDDYGDAMLYRADWSEDGCGLLDAYRTLDVVLLQASGQENVWRLRVRFDDRERFEEFNEYRRANGIEISVVSIFHPDQPRAGGQFGLTPTQRDTLATALEAGYYDVPREVTHAELAERLGVSQQAVSDRLHRAHGNLVRNALTVDAPDADSPRSGSLRSG